MSGILQMVFAATTASAGPINTVAPVVTGTAQVRQTLSCTTGTWTNVPPVLGYAYQWQRGTTNIPGATSSTYTISYLYSGETIRCIVTATNSEGSRSASSNVTAAVAATTPLAPSIGTASEISNTAGSVQFVPNPDNGGSVVTSYTAISSPGGITGTAGGSPITVSGLTTLTTYSFTVIASNSVGNSPSSGSSNSITPGAVAPVNTSAPTLFGAAVVRVPLYCDPGTWSGAPTPNISYQWQSQSTGDIPGATGQEYTPSSSYYGQQLRCRVTGSNVAGSAQAFTVYSSSVSANTPETPTNLFASITDPGLFPTRITITCTPPDNGGSTITGYTWYFSRDGGSYLPGGSSSGPSHNFSGQAGFSYTFKCWATNAIGNSDFSAPSNSVSVPA